MTAKTGKPYSTFASLSGRQSCAFLTQVMEDVVPVNTRNTSRPTGEI